MLLLGLLLAQQYRFPVGQAAVYQADMKFEGFLPILGIGQGKAEVHGTFEVLGKSESQAAVKLTAFEVTFNGGKVPIDLDDAQKYVPGGTFTFDPTGKILSWDAPVVATYIRIPGLDLKHLPEVLFLPIPFPKVGIEEGKSFTFSLPLSGGVADYEVTPGARTPDSFSFSLKLHQSYADLEDDANQVVPEKDAAFRVTTDVVGTGSGTFDTRRGRFTRFAIDDVATSRATDLQSKKTTSRKLTRHLVVTS